MVTGNQHIEIIVSRIEQDTAGYFSIFFDRPQNFTFEAGDWMDLEFDGQTLKGGVTYSLSSSPTESDLRITFREGMSEFKNALQAVKRSDRLFITQYGNDYGFQLKKHQSSVLIAGGVGIAPFRSMIKEMLDTEAKNDVTLIYLNQTEDFLFRRELEEWSGRLPGVSVTFISTNEINRKKREQLILSLIKDSSRNFYISGPPRMVESTEHLLLDQGVALRDIRTDIFGGY